MNKKGKQTFKVTVLVAVLFAVYGSALAGGDTSVVLEQNSVAVGAGNWSNDRPHEGQYDGMSDSGAYGLFDADILKRDDATGTWLGLKARNLGLDDREIKGEWLRQGNIGFSLEYSRLPHDYPYTYNTGLQGIGTTTQTVTNITPGTGVPVELETHRDRYTAKFFKNVMPGLSFNVSYRNEKKDGTRPWGYRGAEAQFLTEPIDSTTQQLEATVNYSRDRLQLSGGYIGSKYDNNNSLVTVYPGPNYVDLPLDNKSWGLFLKGGYQFSATTRGTAKVSYSRATQDNTLPTANPALGLADPVAPTNLDGRVDTTVVDVGVTSRPMPKLSVLANWHYRDYADKTPVQVVTPNANPVNQFTTTPMSYLTNDSKVEATYQLPQAYSLLGGVEYKYQKNSIQPGGSARVPQRPDWNEWTYRIQLRKSMSETVNGSLAYLHSKRDGSDYVMAVQPQENNVNPFNMADRKRDKVRAMLDWAATDKLAFQFAIEDSRDKYSGFVGPYGLQKGTGQLYSVDGSYQLNSEWQLHAWFTRDETKADEVTQQTTTNIKYNTLKETGDSFGAGFNGQISSKLKVGGNVEQFRSTNEYTQNLAGGTLSTQLVPTPDITNTLLRFKLFAQYAVQKNGEVRVDLIQEKFSSGDWYWLMFPSTGGTAPYPIGVNTDGTTATQDPTQSSFFVGVRYIYKFQ